MTFMFNSCRIDCLCVWFVCIICKQYVHTYIPTYLPNYLPTYLRTYIRTYIHTYTHTYMHAYMHACMHASIHPYIHTSIHPYIHTSIHPYIHTSIHTYIHTYIHCKWQQLQLNENDGNFDTDPVQTNDKPNVPKDQTVLSHHVLCSCCFPMPAESAKVPDWEHQGWQVSVPSFPTRFRRHPGLYEWTLPHVPYGCKDLRNPPSPRLELPWAKCSLSHS